VGGYRSRVAQGLTVSLASTPAPAVEPRRSEQGSFVWRDHCEIRLHSFIRSLRKGGPDTLSHGVVRLSL
jgi:hypothetical protein